MKQNKRMTALPLGKRFQANLLKVLVGTSSMKSTTQNVVFTSFDCVVSSQLKLLLFSSLWILRKARLPSSSFGMLFISSIIVLYCYYLNPAPQRGREKVITQSVLRWRGDKAKARTEGRIRIRGGVRRGRIGETRRRTVRRVTAEQDTT